MNLHEKLDARLNEVCEERNAFKARVAELEAELANATRHEDAQARVITSDARDLLAKVEGLEAEVALLGCNIQWTVTAPRRLAAADKLAEAGKPLVAHYKRGLVLTNETVVFLPMLSALAAALAEYEEASDG